MKAYMNWSSGKDSALAFYRAQQSGLYDIAALFTVVHAQSQNVPMHETPLALIHRQAQSIGVPLTSLPMEPGVSDDLDRTQMLQWMVQCKQQGIDTALFGDLYLEPLRARREKKLEGSGIQAAFPLWGSQPRQLMDEWIDAGFKAILTCVDGAVLDESFLGRTIDAQLLRDLPPSADLCGERGEYHSFVFDGPIFRSPVPFRVIRKYYRDYPAMEKGGQGCHRYGYLDIG